MRPSEVFRTYNRRQIRHSRALWALVAVSTLIAVAVSLAVPQVMHSSRQNGEAVAADAVGADLRVIAPFDSTAFENALVQAQSRQEAQAVLRHGLHMSSVNIGDNHQLIVVVDGEETVAADGAVVSAPLASRLRVGVGDRVEVQGAVLTVERIEQVGAPDTTSEAFGYVKTSAPDWGPKYAESIMITSSTPDELRDRLKDAEDGYTYTTVSSQRASTAEQLGMSFLALNALSTMCMLATVISLFSCIVLVLRQRRSHIAVMRMVGVPARSIRYGFVCELLVIVSPAIMVGTVLSPFVARIILDQQNMRLYMSLRILSAGFVFFLLTYCVCLVLISKSIANIHAYDVTRGSDHGTKLRVADSFSALIVAFALMTFAYCAVILRSTGMFTSSVLVMFTVCVFGLIGGAVIALTTLPRWRFRLLQFASRTTRGSILSTTSTVVSMALLLWFILFGFGFSSVFKQTLNESLDAKLSYNFLVLEDGKTNVSNVIDGSGSVSAWTRIYCNNGTVSKNGNTHAVTLAGVDRTQYETPFIMTSGTDLLELADDEVLISDRLSDELGISVGDVMRVARGGTEVGYVVAGSYDSGTVNDNYLLFPVEGKVDASRVIDLVEASGPSFLNGLQGAVIADVSSIGEAFSSLVDSFLALFQQLCLVCVVAIVFFNTSLVVMKYVEPKDLVICRSIGVPFRFLLCSFLLRQLLSFALSVLLAIALFHVMASAASTLLLGAPASVTWEEVYLPACTAIASAMLVFTAFEVFQLRRAMTRYELLRV